MIDSHRPALDDIAISMKGCGFYDRNCSLQETVVARVESVLDEIVSRFDISSAPQPFTIVDYGCAEGRNSLRVSKSIIDLLRRRGFGEEIHVIHNDLADNDFAKLIDVVVDEHRGRSAKVLSPSEARVVRTLAPGSFYNQVVSADTVALALSTTSVHWLSSTADVRVAEHVSAEGAPPAVQAQMAAAARRDWVRFLRFRGAELAPGGRLVVTMVGRVENDPLIHGPFRLIDAIARQWLDEGRLSRRQYESFVLPVYRRTQSEATAPFQVDDELGDKFELNHCEQFRVPCPFQSQFERDGDAAAYAQRYAGFVRAICEPVVAHLLGAGNPLSMDLARVDAFFSDLESRAAASPGEFVPTNVHVMVIATRR